jgi:hypothetical protein
MVKTAGRWNRLCVLLLLPAFLPVEVRADLYTAGFARISSNSTADLEGQLFVDITNDGYEATNQVLFRFRNEKIAGWVPSSICDVYFDDGSLLGIATLIDMDNGGDPGVQFSVGANPSELPNASSASPPFVTTVGFSADSDPAVQPNGVAPGEWLGIVFDLQPGKNFQSVIDALLGVGLTSPGADGGLRIGIHVQGLPGNNNNDGESDSYVNTPAEFVPVPGAVVLVLLGLSAAGLKLRRFA